MAILAMRVQEDRSHSRLIPANDYGDAEDDTAAAAAAAADADDDDT